MPKRVRDHRHCAFSRFQAGVPHRVRGGSGDFVWGPACVGIGYTKCVWGECGLCFELCVGFSAKRSG